jgi:hypothetical protein
MLISIRKTWWGFYPNIVKPTKSLNEKKGGVHMNFEVIIQAIVDFFAALKAFLLALHGEAETEAPEEE